MTSRHSQSTQVVTRDAVWQQLEALKSNRRKRTQTGTFFVEGVRAINLALQHGWVIDAWVHAPVDHLSDWAAGILASHPAPRHYQLTEPLLQALSNKGDRSELCAVIQMRSQAIIPSGQITAPLLALFDRPSNKGNLGNIMRTCDGFGLHGLAITGHAVDPYDPDTIASSMGSLFAVPFAHLPDRAGIEGYLETLSSIWPDLQVIGTSAHAERRLDEADFRLPTLLMIGNETEGLSRHAAGLCDHMVSIPMAESASATSFNVASAAAMMFYEANRQRNWRSGGSGRADSAK